MGIWSLTSLTPVSHLCHLAWCPSVGSPRDWKSQPLYYLTRITCIDPKSVNPQYSATLCLLINFFFFPWWIRNQELDVLHELFAGHSPSPFSLGLFSVSAFVPGSLAFWFLVGFGGWQALMGNQKVGGERGQGIPGNDLYNSIPRHKVLLCSHPSSWFCPFRHGEVTSPTVASFCHFRFLC